MQQMIRDHHPITLKAKLVYQIQILWEQLPILILFTAILLGIKFSIPVV
jgi:hypothetical protein